MPATPPFDVTEAIELQAVPRIKSGQVPQVYSPNHRSAFLNKPFILRKGDGEVYADTLIGWCEKTFLPSLLVERTHKTTGVKYNTVPIALPSLAAAGLPLYPAYDDHERAVFTPATTFYLKTFTSNGARQRFIL